MKAAEAELGQAGTDSNMGTPKDANTAGPPEGTCTASTNMMNTTGNEELTVVEGKGTKPIVEGTTSGSTGGQQRARPGKGEVGPRAQRYRVTGAKPRAWRRTPGTR